MKFMSNSEVECAEETEKNIPDIDIPHSDLVRQLNHRFLKLDHSHVSGRLSVSISEIGMRT
jgi:hypothetical protein